MFLAALGERDEEVAASNPEPLDAEQRRRARRQAIEVWAKSLVTGVATAAVLWLALRGPR